MLYYFVNSQGESAGPVELEMLYAGMREGTLTGGTMAVAEGSSDWVPLSMILRYYYMAGEEVLGPVPLADLPGLSGAGEPGLMVAEEGGKVWTPFDSLVRKPVVTPVRMQVMAVREPVQSRPRPRRRRPRGVPCAAQIAGIMWIILGALKLISCFVVVPALSLVPDSLRTILWVAWIIGVFAALVFLRAGIQTCNGKARDTLHNGIGSIGIGIVLLLLSYQSALISGEKSIGLRHGLPVAP